MLLSLHNKRTNHDLPVACISCKAITQKNKTAVLRHSRLILVTCYAILCSIVSFAQSPTITSSTGIPTGNANARGVAYGNGVYVSIMYNGTVFTSADGEVWTQADPGVSSVEFYRIAFGAGTFVIAGKNGLILSSANGTTWTSRTSGTTTNLYDIQFLDSKFFALGIDQTLITSADGTTWSTITIGTGTAGDDFQNITYGNGVFAIAARPPSGGGLLIYRSTTGTSGSWTVQNVAFATINKVQFLKDRFFIFCSNTNVYTSTDASSWTNSTGSMVLTLPNTSTQTIGSPNQAFNGIYDGSKIYFFGYSQYHSSYGSIFSSTDGVNFTLEPKTAYIVCQGSAYINGKYFQYGNEGIISSDNGLSYHYPSGSYTGLASSGTSYVGVGAVSNAGVIFTSPDFINWTEKTPGAINSLYAVAYTGTKFLAVGKRTVVESTDNGATWTEIATPNDQFNAMAWGASRFAAAGYDPNTWVPRIAYSSDGITWTTANTDNNDYFKIRFVNGNFFALGYSFDTYLGIILQSADGITWTDITPNLAYDVYYYNDVVYDGTKYHFMGMEWADYATSSYDDFFSVSTATPSDPNSFSNKGTITTPPGGAMIGGYYGEGAFSYSNGRFVGAANDLDTEEGYILYSTNGTDWTAEPLGEDSYIYGVVAEGDMFRMMGWSDTKLSVNFSSSTLPVSLTRFHVSPVNGQSLVKWQTDGEQNSHHFTIQHTTDGMQWNSIGTVAAAGQSTSIRNYQFIHTNPVTGINYYRLIQTDIDGKKQVSPVRQVHIGTPLSIRLYPNPAADKVMLELPSAQPALVVLYNGNGQQVYHRTHYGSNIQLSLQQLPAGMYKVVIRQGGEKYTQQLYHQ